MPFWAQFPSGRDVLVPPGVQGAPPAPPGWGSATACQEWESPGTGGEAQADLLGRQLGGCQLPLRLRPAWSDPCEPCAGLGPQPVSRPRCPVACWRGHLWPLEKGCVGWGARSLSLSVNFKNHGTIVSRLESAQTSGAQLGEVTRSTLQIGEGDVPPALGLRPHPQQPLAHRASHVQHPTFVCCISTPNFWNHTGAQVDRARCERPCLRGGWVPGGALVLPGQPRLHVQPERPCPHRVADFHTRLGLGLREVGGLSPPRPGHLAALCPESLACWAELELRPPQCVPTPYQPWACQP